MTSPAKLRANRRNAAKSTGPRTPAGKAAVARNARRHGFSIPVLVDDPTLMGEVGELGQRIAVEVRASWLGIPAEAPVELVHRHLAGRIAETLVDLRRVRTAKLPLVAEVAADLRNCLRPLKALARLDRYEGRALSRRKRAVRDFQAELIAAAEIGRTKPAEKAK